MRKFYDSEFESPEIVEWEGEPERGERCFPLPAVFAAIGLAAASCRPWRYCRPRYGCSPRCYPYVSCTPTYVCYPAAWY